ncbi:MAG: transposase [Pedobacter sp.]
MPPKTSLKQFEKMFHSEQKGRRFLESAIWKDGRFCPHWGSLSSWPIKKKSVKRRPGLYECADCGTQFTATVKTPFHSMKLPRKTWF